MAHNEDNCGIEGAVYQRVAGGLETRLFCSCGFVAKGETWEEAGIELDGHLSETAQEQGGREP